MSDDDSSPATVGPAAALHLRDSRWLAGAIWAGLLAALLVTSVAAVESFTQGSIASRYFTLGNPSFPASDNRDHALAIAGVVMSALAALALLAAWYSFVRTTRSLVLAYADAGASDDEEPAAAEWLMEGAARDGSTVYRAMPSELLLYVGMAWAAIIMTPAVLGAVEAFS
jgi:hypothetical protein